MSTETKKIYEFTFKKNDSIWMGNLKDKICQITGFDIDGNSLYVYHNLNWQVYTSKQFEEEVQNLLEQKGYSVKFVDWSEQGLQENCIAHFDIELK